MSRQWLRNRYFNTSTKWAYYYDSDGILHRDSHNNLKHLITPDTITAKVEKPPYIVSVVGSVLFDHAFLCRCADGQEWIVPAAALQPNVTTQGKRYPVEYTIQNFSCRYIANGINYVKVKWMGFSHLTNEVLQPGTSIYNAYISTERGQRDPMIHVKH